MNVPEIFGTMVFNENVMKARLPREVYRSLKQTSVSGEPLDISIANIVADAMKDWAVEKGATHYTHWFQPMNGITAEKHDSFISPVGGGSIIMEFSGKELVRGEPDASSFPSGGLRATFEARGYTAWDPTSYAFVKDGTLCIPTAFCSYGGEALDQKTPLLRSMEAFNKQTMRVLRAIGNDKVKGVMTTVGAEQEYFLVDRAVYDARPDLSACGRTLFGAKPPKGQELDDHYFGALKPRVSQFMKDLNQELWKLGIYATTEHNEAAPAQHELAPIFEQSNVATDHNQLMMEMLKLVANRHSLACLLHEKPFEGINGSGKHNNWSISTDTGENLLDPGKTPSSNKQFLLFLCAVIKAVDEYQDLLRFSVTSAGNDHRLGGYEAPPAIISMFLGDDITRVLEDIESEQEHVDKKRKEMSIGASVLPSVLRDTTDRNRTSPFAFTGNKFEFRMVGSSQSIAGCNVVLNTIVAESLRGFADRLEAASDSTAEVDAILRDTIRGHKRIVFNGNNYTEEWEREAEKRGLLNLKATPDAAKCFLAEKNVALFKLHGVYTEVELHSQYEILLEKYIKTVGIEASVMLDMARRNIVPAVIRCSKEYAQAAAAKKSVGSLSTVLEDNVLRQISDYSEELYNAVDHLERKLKDANGGKYTLDKAFYASDVVVPAMHRLRAAADKLEQVVAKDCWPYPDYLDILFSVN